MKMFIASIVLCATVIALVVIPVYAANEPFVDVSAGDAYYTDVVEAYNLGIIKGITNTTFWPNANATRGQTVTMLYRLNSEPEVSGVSVFTDLTQDYYKDAVLWAEQNGITNGTGATTFSPGRTITRQELASLLYRAAGSPAVYGTLSDYSDGGKVRGYAMSAMVWVAENDIIEADGTLRPEDTITRAELCSALLKYWTLTGG